MPTWLPATLIAAALTALSCRDGTVERAATLGAASAELSPVSCTTPTPTTVCSGESAAASDCFLAMDHPKLRKEFAQFFRVPAAGTPGHIRLYLKRLVDPPQTNVVCSADGNCPGYSAADPMAAWCNAGRCNSNPALTVSLCEAIGTVTAPRVDLDCEAFGIARLHARALPLGLDTLVDLTLAYAGGHTMDPARVYVAIFRAEQPDVPGAASWMTAFSAGCDPAGDYPQRALARQSRKISATGFTNPAFAPERSNLAFAMTMGDGALRCTADADCGTNGNCNLDTGQCQTCEGAGGIDLRTDVNNCGTCGNVCTAANAVPACVQGQCDHSVCTPGFYEMDGNRPNGCETQCLGRVCTNTLTQTTVELTAPMVPRWSLEVTPGAADADKVQTSTGFTNFMSIDTMATDNRVFQTSESYRHFCGLDWP